MQVLSRQRLASWFGSSLPRDQWRRSQRSSLGSESRTGAALFISTGKIKLWPFLCGKRPARANLDAASPAGDGYDDLPTGGTGGQVGPGDDALFLHATDSRQ